MTLAPSGRPYPRTATLVPQPLDGRADPGRLRDDVQLAAAQLRAVSAFHAARHAAEQSAVVAAAGQRSRELRMDLERRLEVVRRQHDALIGRAAGQLRESGDLLFTAPRNRVVLAHRNAWFVDRVGTVLREHGVRVIATADNGADTVGIAVAEQPDLVLVEETLAMVPGEQVVREVLEYCPETLVAAQVSYRDRVQAFVDAGAQAVFTRQVPPADVGSDLARLVGG